MIFLCPNRQNEKLNLSFRRFCTDFCVFSVKYVCVSSFLWKYEHFLSAVTCFQKKWRSWNVFFDRCTQSHLHKNFPISLLRLRPLSGLKISQIFYTFRFQWQILQPGSWHKENFKNRAKIAIYGHFLMFFEVISILIAWFKLMTLHLSSTNFLGNFEINYSSWSVLIRKLISGIEFVFCRQI